MKQKPFKSIGSIGMVIIAAILLVSHFHIKDFCVIIPDVLYTSGQPRNMDYMRLLYKYHLSTIVNVRPATEHKEKNWRNEELVWTKEHAVKYVEIPFEKQNYLPNRQTQDAFFSIMGDKENLPVLLHGGGDDKRVAMLTAAWLRKKQGFSVEDALAQAKKIIDDRPLTQDEINFIRNLQ
jgi:protein tyrosine/serine phosphatase